MNQIYLAYRYDENGDKCYLRDPANESVILAFSDFSSLSDYLGHQTFNTGFEVEIFFNPIQDCL